MLVFDHRYRITVDGSLCHPYLRRLHTGSLALHYEHDCPSIFTMEEYNLEETKRLLLTEAYTVRNRCNNLQSGEQEIGEHDDGSQESTNDDDDDSGDEDVCRPLPTSF